MNRLSEIPTYLDIGEDAFTDIYNASQWHSGVLALLEYSIVSSARYDRQDIVSTLR